MNDDQLSDLKQFITVTISQATADMATKDDLSTIAQKLDDLDKKVDDGFAGIGEAFDDMNKQVDERLIKLEQQAA